MPDAGNYAVTTLDQLDSLFLQIDTHFLSGELEKVDALLKAVDVTQLDPTMIVGWLVVTRVERQNLKERENFVTRAEAALLKQTGDAARTNRMLANLR